MNKVHLQRPKLLLALILILGALCIAFNVALYLLDDGNYLLFPLVLPLVLTWHYIVPGKSGSLLVAVLAVAAGLYLLWNLVFMAMLWPVSLLPTSYLVLMVLLIGLVFACLFLIVHAARIRSDLAQNSPHDVAGPLENSKR